jgi:EAL domain-containing protein (putative c-di-GMP-specific phosphodiesterase class I)
MQMKAIQRGLTASRLRMRTATRGLDDKDAPTASPFDRRRSRMLRLWSFMLLATTVPWAGYLLRRDALLLASLECSLAFCALAMLMLVRLHLLRAASFVFVTSAVLGVVGVALMVDIPSPGFPRTVHLYLIPTCIANIFLLQNEKPAVRVGLSVLILAMFCILGLYPLDLGLTELTDLSGQHVAAFVNTLSAALAVFVVMSVMLEEAKETLKSEADFARAIIEGEIQAYLQPQCLADGTIVGAEALMRWRHPERGFISPADFIPIAERSGLINQAGQRVLDDVCNVMLRWQHIEALKNIPVSVNISRVQLKPATVAQLVEAVPRSLSSRGLIKFELTESIFVDNFAATCELLTDIRARGICISLDDFGTGFSSLGYLRQLPLDDLKLDQSFVRHLPADHKSVKIARGILNLGRDLGFDVIAEGVENRSQLESLKDMGCTRFQGFLFHRPMPLLEFEGLILKNILHREPPPRANDATEQALALHC